MKLVWSVNPFDRKLPLEPMARLLAHLGKRPVRVEAVFVADLRGRETGAVDLAAGEAKLKRALTGTGVSKHAVIWDVSGSHSAQVEELLHHAVGERADMVAVYAHGRGAAARFYHGSFSESLATASPLPVLVANPDHRLPSKVQRVLYATDFSLASQKAYGDLVALAAALGWRLTVLHAADPLYPGDPAQQTLKLKRRKARIERTARDAGVEVTFVLDESFKAVPHVIQQTALDFDSDLVCVAAQRRPTRHLLLGSVTRRLLRESELPVLILKA